MLATKSLPSDWKYEMNRVWKMLAFVMFVFGAEDGHLAPFVSLVPGRIARFADVVK